LIGGDNKGLASYFFEKDAGTDYSSDSTFVAAFAQSNAGDVTPNLWGPADGEHDYQRQYEKARSLFDSADFKDTRQMGKIIAMMRSKYSVPPAIQSLAAHLPNRTGLRTLLGQTGS
jgi:hypothetical protein